MTASSLTVEPLWLDDLERRAVSQRDWLLHGYLAPGNVTLLTSQWKAGKTTLLALLLDRMKAGGELAGLPVKPGKALVVTEEPAEKWLERSRRFDFAGNVCWLCRPFAGKPRQADWQALIGQVLDLHHRFGLALAAIDPLASFLPFRSENDAGEMLAALLPLHRLTAEGLSVLLLHHPRKKPSADGQCSRGSGALCGFVDILLEMHWVGAAESEDRRRRVLAWSRHEETPRQRLMELSADGRSYVLLESPEEEADSPLRLLLWQVLESASTKLTRAEIVADWPSDYPKPPSTTLWRLLDREAERGELKRDGTGVKADPYRYWLASLEERWRTDPVARLLQQIADATHCTRRELSERDIPQ
jgi:hypothetical protein